MANCLDCGAEIGKHAKRCRGCHLRHVHSIPGIHAKMARVKGSKFPCSEETKAKISAANAGRLSLEKHPRWKGNQAQPASIKMRGNRVARKLFPLAGDCVECKKVPATIRHHIDGDSHNNERENIMFLCQPCHLIVDNPKHRQGSEYHSTHQV